jgi:hypothetical protein
MFHADHAHLELKVWRSDVVACAFVAHDLKCIYLYIILNALCQCTIGSANKGPPCPPPPSPIIRKLQIDRDTTTWKIQGELRRFVRSLSLYFLGNCIPADQSKAFFCIFVYIQTNTYKQSIGGNALNLSWIKPHLTSHASTLSATINLHSYTMLHRLIARAFWQCMSQTHVHVVGYPAFISSCEEYHVGTLVWNAYVWFPTEYLCIAETPFSAIIT